MRLKSKAHFSREKKIIMISEPEKYLIRHKLFGNVVLNLSSNTQKKKKNNKKK